MLALRRGLHLLALRRIEHAALDQLLDQRRDVGEAARGLHRAELQPQCRGVHACFTPQRLEYPQSLLWLATLQRDLRGKRQPWNRQASHLRFRPAEKFFGARVLTHVERRTRANQCGDAGCARERQRFVGLLLRLAVASFEQRDRRSVELGT